MARGKTINARRGLHQAIKQSRKFDPTQSASGRLMALMFKEQQELETNQSEFHAETLLDTLDKWALNPEKFARTLPQTLFMDLPVPAKNFGRIAIVPTWQNKILASDHVLAEYPATLIALRAEIRSWIATPTALAETIKDIELAINWQIEHLVYLKDALKNSPRRHPAWELYGLLAKQTFDNKSQPRSVAINLADAELARFEKILANLHTGAPFILGPAFKSMKGQSTQRKTSLEEKIWDYTLRNALGGNLELAKRYDELYLRCLSLEQTEFDSKITNLNKLNAKTAAPAARYLLNRKRSGSYSSGLWLHDNLQKELNNITDPHLAGDDHIVLETLAQKTTSSHAGELKPVDTLGKALQSIDLISKAPAYFRASHGRRVDPSINLIEKCYGLMVKPNVINELLTSFPYAQVETYTNRYQFPAKEGKTRGGYGWQTRAIGTMRMQDSAGVFHTIRLNTIIGESNTRNFETAQQKIIDASDLNQLPAKQSLRIKQLPKDAHPFNISPGYTGLVDPTNLASPWQKSRTQAQIDALAAYPFQKIKDFNQALQTHCRHPQTEWVSMPHITRSFLQRKRCKSCNHPRLETRWIHQDDQHGRVFDLGIERNATNISLSIDKGMTIEFRPTDYFNALNDYVLASGKRTEPYQDLTEAINDLA